MRRRALLLALTLATCAFAEAQEAPRRRPPQPAEQPAPAWLGGPHGPMAPPATGFDLCVTPRAPDCAQREEIRRSASARKLCEEETTRFIAQVFAYRTCLEGEMARAVRGANEALGMVRCGRSSPSDCPAR